MGQTSFYDGLNNHVLKWTTPVPGSASTYGGPLRANESLFRSELQPHNESVFEQLLLFDSVSFNISGPNTIAPVLYNSMGPKAFERLLEQNAFNFVVWQPVPYISSDKGKVAATFVGRVGDGTNYEIDPERIVDYGLSLCPSSMSNTYKRNIRRKLVSIHSLLDERLANDTWTATQNALSAGIFEDDGLDRDLIMLGSSKDLGDLLVKAASSVLRYKYLLSKGLTSFEDYGIYDIYQEGVSNLKSGSNILANFSTIAEYAEFPQLKTLYHEIESPFDRASKFRDSHTAREFRSWIGGISNNSHSPVSVIREYVDACAGRRGLFESKSAKFIKAVGMVGVGQLISHNLAESTIVGAALTSIPLPIVDKVIDAGVELCTSVADSFIIENIKVGWTPKAYIRGLKNIRKRHKAQSSA